MTLTLDVTATVTPFPGERLSGDAAIVVQRDDVALLAVVDALGHGEVAAAVAAVAQRTIEACAGAPLDELLRHCHTALAGSRGAAIGAARLDLARGRLCYGGVGNVEGRLVRRGARAERLVSFGGIVGSILPTLRLFDFALGPGDLILLHSDGISARFDLRAYPALTEQSPTLIAGVIARDWARERDDQSILVARVMACGEGSTL